MGLSYEDLTNGIFRNISKDEDIRISRIMGYHQPITMVTPSGYDMIIPYWNIPA